eukprot:3951066-Prymnesium_polylepis.1
MIALTPCPLNAFWIKYNADTRALVESHFESLKANRRSVRGSRWSATPSLLLLISRSAWYTPTLGDQGTTL